MTSASGRDGRSAAQARSQRAGSVLLSVLAAVLVAVPATGCGGDGGTGPVPGLPPSVLHVEQEVLQRGERAVLHGLNFAPRAEDNVVRVAGARAEVLGPASETRLEVRVPEGGTGSCAPTGPVEVSVTVEGRTGTATHPLAPVPPLQLPAGSDTAMLEPPDVGCQNLPADEALYLVSAFNSAEAAGFSAGFRIRGRPGEPSGASTPGASAPRRDRRDGGPTGAGSPKHAAGLDLPSRLLEGRGREAEILRRGGELLGRLEEPPVHRSPGPLPLGAAQPPAEGDLVQYRVPDLSRAEACTNFRAVTGRVVEVTAHAVVVEDTAAPLAGEMDETFRSLAAEYESVMDPIIREYFGDPAAYDHRLDGDGRFVMLFSPAVNDLSGVLAFVWGGDFGSRSSCASSDEAEIFYGLVPIRHGSEPEDLGTIGGWERVMRPTTIHEVKHIAAFAEHRAGGAARQEDSWLEEATAMVAEELYAREIFGYGPLENTTYEDGLACELNPGDAGCGDAPLIMAAHFVFLRDYLSAVENRSPLGGGLASLGGGWWLLRWALDHAPTGEAQFLRAMTRETEVYGVENLEARAGRPFREMLAEWSLALGADDAPDLAEPPRPEVTVPSWDVRSVFAGLHRDRPDAFPTPYPLDPRRQDYGDFLLSVSGLPGGSASLLELSAPATGSRQQLLQVLGADGGAPPEELGLSILRLR